MSTWRLKNTLLLLGVLGRQFWRWHNLITVYYVVANFSLESIRQSIKYHWHLISLAAFQFQFSWIFQQFLADFPILTFSIQAGKKSFEEIVVMKNLFVYSFFVCLLFEGTRAERCLAWNENYTFHSICGKSKASLARLKKIRWEKRTKWIKTRIDFFNHLTFLSRFVFEFYLVFGFLQ